MLIDFFNSADFNLKILSLHEETIGDLIAKVCPRCINAYKTLMVFIDYLQFILPVGRGGYKQKIDNSLRKLNAFQTDTHTTFIAVSSFNRGNYFNSVAKTTNRPNLLIQMLMKTVNRIK